MLVIWKMKMLAVSGVLGQYDDFIMYLYLPTFALSKASPQAWTSALYFQPQFHVLLIVNQNKWS